MQTRSKGQTDNFNKHTFKFRSLILPTVCTKGLLKASLRYAGISATSGETQSDARGLKHGDVPGVVCDMQ